MMLIMMGFEVEINEWHGKADDDEGDADDIILGL